MLRLADLQKKIDGAAEEMRHLTQDDQDRRPFHRELRQDSSFHEDEWYDDFHHGNFTFDDASPLAAELQATPWPQSYKPPQLPMYDRHLDPKQFLMSYEATNILVWGNTVVMAKSFVMVVRSVALDLVFLPSAKNNHIMAEAQGYASHQFPRLSDEANHCSGFVSMHTRP
jgi:hypothetical protein